jgi:hypothetical protein
LGWRQFALDEEITLFEQLGMLFFEPFDPPMKPLATGGWSPAQSFGDATTQRFARFRHRVEDGCENLLQEVEATKLVRYAGENRGHGFGIERGTVRGNAAQGQATLVQFAAEAPQEGLDILFRGGVIEYLVKQATLPMLVNE